MKPNNRGLSLVELVVVIGLMVLLFSLSILGISAMTQARQSQTAVSISAMISKTRINSLAKSGAVYLELSVDAQGDIVCSYFENGRLMNTETLPAAGQSLRYTLKAVSGGADQSLSLSEAPLRLAFEKSTGAQEHQGGYVCTALIFSGMKTQTLSLVPSTGAQSLDESHR